MTSYAVIAVLCLLPAVLCNTSGPPVLRYADLCTDMIPVGHNNGVSQAVDQDAPPYTVTTTSDKYAPGSTVRVTISGSGSGSNYVKGFFVQARRTDPARNNDVAIGTFSGAPANTQLLRCHGVENSAWGHSNSEARTTITAIWNAPAQDQGPLEFRATIVKGVPNRNYFYLNIRSTELNFTTDAPSVSDGTSESTTPSSGPSRATSFPVVSVVVMVTAILSLL